MSGADIAGLLAAVVFAILVGLIAIPLVKLGRVLDETRQAIRSVSDNVTPLLEEITDTVSQANKQLGRVDAISGSLSEASANLAALVALFAATVGGPLIKLAGFSAGLKAMFSAGLRKKPRTAKN